jgi:transcriptional regulator with XRE-family HTH domain
MERRRRAGLTQTQVAERLGRPQRFISWLERGLHRVTVVELIEFGQTLEFDAAVTLRRLAKAAGYLRARTFFPAMLAA